MLVGPVAWTWCVYYLLGARLDAGRAGKVKQRANSLEITSGLQTKARGRSPVLDILQSVVPEIHALVEKRAGNILPVDTSVFSIGLSSALSRSRDGPTGLRDPDRLSLRNVLGLLESIVESGVGATNAVVVLNLPEGVGINTQKVEVGDNVSVARVVVCGPSVDMSNRLSGQTGTCDGFSDFLDVVDQLARLSTRVRLAVLNGSRRDAVQVLASHRDTAYQVGESRAVLGNGVLEGGDFVVDNRRSGRSPDTQQEFSLGVDGSLDSRDDIAGSSVLDHGVQTSTVELAVGAGQLLSSFELVLEIDILLGLLVAKESTVVEPFGGGVGARESGCSSQKCGCEVHGGIPVGVKGNRCSQRREEGDIRIIKVY